jgi:hypothetical protein
VAQGPVSPALWSSRSDKGSTFPPLSWQEAVWSPWTHSTQAIGARCLVWPKPGELTLVGLEVCLEWWSVHMSLGHWVLSVPGGAWAQLTCLLLLLSPR